ncbi:MAG: lysylphosphatidylglycerol synthase transmembrane domain-containing protein [Pseudomonadota bacterium]
MDRPKLRNSPLGGTFFLSLLAGASVLGLMVWFVPPGQLFAVLATGNGSLIAVACAVSLSSTLLRTYRYLVFFSADDRFARAYSVFSLSRFLNLAFPFRTGDLAVLAILKRNRLSPSIAETAPVWMVLKAADALAITIWFSVIVGMSAFAERYFAFGAVAVIGALGLMVGLQFAPSLLSGRRRARAGGWVGSRLEALLDGLEHMGGTVQKFQAIGLSLIIWGMLISTSVLMQTAFSTPLSTGDAALVTVLVLAVSLLPVHAPLGIGTGEAIWVAVMVMIGVPLEEALPLAIAIRLASLGVLFLEALVGSTVYSLSAPVDDRVVPGQPRRQSG